MLICIGKKKLSTVNGTQRIIPDYWNNSKPNANSGLSLTFLLFYFMRDRDRDIHHGELIDMKDGTPSSFQHMEELKHVCN